MLISTNEHLVSFRGQYCLHVCLMSPMMGTPTVCNQLGIYLMRVIMTFCRVFDCSGGSGLELISLLGRWWVVIGRTVD